MPATPGEHIKATRRRLGWTQQDLAAESALSFKTISVAENDGGVKRGTLRRIAVALGLDPSELLGSEEEAS